MMHHNVFQKASGPISLSIRSGAGQLTQIRNHVKMYPWRKLRTARYSNMDNTRTPYTDRFNINEFDIDKRKRKNWQKVIPKEKDNRFNTFHWNESYKSDPKEAKETSASRLSAFNDSLRNRGAAREQEAYNAPNDVENRIVGLFRQCSKNNEAGKDEILTFCLDSDRALKFDLIVRCIEEFRHNLPSSHLNDIESVSQLVEFYSTSVRGVNAYTSLLNSADTLPVNLCLIPEPIRYNTETDYYFKGYNALPGIVSKVPGLRAAKKYPVLNQEEFQWPDI